MSTSQADLASTTPWRRSLRRSRDRRLAAARKRRRRIRGRSVSVVMAFVMTMGAGAALASVAQLGADSAGLLGGDDRLGAAGSRPVSRRCLWGRHQAGRHVVPARSRPDRGWHRRAADPQRARVGRQPAARGRERQRSAAPSLRASGCESGGDPTAVSPNGQYRGKYQFSRATWRSLGGNGDPARAPEAAQDRMAELLLQRSGTSAWPVCGRGSAMSELVPLPSGRQRDRALLCRHLEPHAGAVVRVDAPAVGDLPDEHQSPASWRLAAVDRPRSLGLRPAPAVIADLYPHATIRLLHADTDPIVRARAPV